MILVVQTNVPGALHIWIVSGKNITHHQKHVQYHGANFLLPLIAASLPKKATWKSIDRILVVRGPGAFTAVRVGIVVANTMSMALEVPVKGIITPALLTEKKILSLSSRTAGWTQRLVRPSYGREPNITKSKKS